MGVFYIVGMTSTHRAKCEICMTQSLRAQVDHLYVNFTPVADICEKFKLDPEVLERHVRVANLRMKKFANTKEVYSRIIELGMANPAALDIKAKDVQRAAEWIDRLEGRIIEKKEINGPPRILLIGVPTAGGVMDQPEGEIVQGNLLELGPPQLESSRSTSGDLSSSPKELALATSKETVNG